MIPWHEKIIKALNCVKHVGWALLFSDEESSGEESKTAESAGESGEEKENEEKVEGVDHEEEEMGEQEG